MTMTADPGPQSMRERRQATLERLHGGPRPGPARTLRLPTISKRSGSDVEADAVDARPLGPPPAIWYGIIAVVSVFVTLGLVMVLSASAATEANLGNSPYRVFSRQAMWAGLGVVGLLIAARFPYHWWRRLAIPLSGRRLCFLRGCRKIQSSGA